jgi:hypothetical protein
MCWLTKHRPIIAIRKVLILEINLCPRCSHSACEMVIPRHNSTHTRRKDDLVKTLRVVCVQIINGEKHYVIQSLEGKENPAGSEDFDEAKIRMITKKEASKPLLLLRAE